MAWRVGKSCFHPVFDYGQGTVVATRIYRSKSGHSKSGRTRECLCEFPNGRSCWLLEEEMCERDMMQHDRRAYNYKLASEYTRCDERGNVLPDGQYE